MHQKTSEVSEFFSSVLWSKNGCVLKEKKDRDLSALYVLFLKFTASKINLFLNKNQAETMNSAEFKALK